MKILQKLKDIFRDKSHPIMSPKVRAILDDPDPEKLRLLYKAMSMRRKGRVKMVDISTPLGVISKETANEVMFVLTGQWLTDSLWTARGHFPAEGGPANVSFDYKNVISRESRYGDVIGFYHTHPGQIPSYVSSIDIETMDAWVDTLGKNLLCLIDGANGLKTFYWLGNNHFLMGDSFKDGENFIGHVKSNI